MDLLKRWVYNMLSSAKIRGFLESVFIEGNTQQTESVEGKGG